MIFLIVSFFFGILTVFAPCVFPLLPVIIGESIRENNKKRPLVIIGSLVIFIIFFTVLLKFGEGVLSVPDSTLRIISGGILIIFGLSTLFPNKWALISYKLGFSTKSDQLLHKSSQRKGILRDIFIGGALGPVFTSCSPTYLVILSLALGESDQLKAFLYLISYVAGLGFILLIISFGGQRIVKKFKWATNPNSLFKKIIGLIFIAVGIILIFRVEKVIQDTLLGIPIFESFYSIEADIVNKTLN